ncbi:MAG: HAD family phosphatase [Planctomycetaceae bacterium]|nr:HAD family phosphatase [Planctomycetaceae bacterium]
MNYLALATDYDGTLAENGHVEADVVRALQQLRATGRKVILVTGRELPELKQVFPELGVCDLVVAENGALLYWPETDQEEVLAEGPPEAFLSEVQQRGVGPYSVGRVIFATWRPHEVAVLESLQKLGLGHQIIFNKRAVMVLPEGVNKATGLQVALERLEIPAAQVVGVGDAENDHVFLDNCGVAAAVDNALDALKAHCDLVTSGDHGRGVRELIERMLADDLAHLGPRQPRKVFTARNVEARPAEA